MPTIPTTQRAAVIVEYDKPLEIQSDYPVVAPSELKAGECLVHLTVSGVCHSDVHIHAGAAGKQAAVPFVGGHEGIGRIAALGPGVVEGASLKVGARVGVKWIKDTCGRCELCRTGYESFCRDSKTAGTKVDGTFCEYTVVNANHLVPIPDGIEDHVAAPILCAGLTVYRGLKLSNTKLGDWVVIPGAGGGLGHLAIQYAVALGLRVLAIDSGEVKKSVCLGLGAEKWVDFKHSTDVVKDVVEACDGLGPHAALIIPPIGAAYDDALQYLRTSGTLVMIGLPDNSFKLKTPVVHLIRKGLTVVGTLLGTMQDAIEALDLVARKKVTPHVQLGRLVDMNKIFDELHAGRIVGRTVVKL